MVQVIGAFRPGSLVDLVFCWLLLGLFPAFSVAGLRPADSNDASVQVLMNVRLFFTAAAVVLR